MQPTISGPRDLLDRFGVDSSRWETLADGKPWQSSDDEVLLRILYRTPRMRLSDLQRWAKRLDSLRLADNPGVHRGEVYRIAGRAVDVEVLRPASQLAASLDLPEYFRVEFKLTDGQRASVFAREVPDAWKTTGRLDDRASALGFFLKFAKDTGGRSMPVFVAPRVAWYPDTLLGNLGMDIGLLDDVWQEEKAGGPEAGGAAAKIQVGRLRLTSRDREAFYQMLAAAGRAPPRQLFRDARERLDRSHQASNSVIPLFNEPKTQLGRLVVLSGTVRRIIPVRIGDEDIIARLGFDRYYEIYLFTDDSQENPVVFCVRELPPGMPVGEGPQFGESAEIAGFFFKTWAYRRAESASPGQLQWQLAPLLIGREPIWLPARRSDSGYGPLTAGVLVLVLLGLSLMVWQYQRSDRKYRKRASERLPAARDAAREFENRETQNQADFDHGTAMDSGRVRWTDDSDSPRP